VPDKLSIAHQVVADLGIAGKIKHLYFEEVDSPWNEKALIKRKKGLLEVKFTIWKEDRFLLGRMYHIFLYIYDVLNPSFLYDPGLTPDEEKESEARDIYNQVWSIYVDSRIERRGIENFYDRLVRRNLFIEMADHLPWQKAEALFQQLWDKESYTYREIVDYAYAFLNDRRTGEEGQGDNSCLEVALAARLRTPGVRAQIEKIGPEPLRRTANDLLSYIAYHCKDALIKGTYFGILVIYSRKVFIEMIPCDDGRLLLTILDAASNTYTTHTLSGESDVGEVQETILQLYKKIALNS
jgi:hypothetical protein